MARIIKIGLAALALSVGTLAIVAGTKGMEAARPITVSAAIKSVELSNEQLKNVTLVDHVFQEGKTDKIFRIPLDNGAYIDGAILFNDCSYQYTGTTLGEAFGLHNTDDKPNSYNFNILFSFERISEMRVNADVTSYLVDPNGYERTLMMAKYAQIDGDFYDALSSTDYSQLVGPAGSSSFYKNGSQDFNTSTCTLDASKKEQGVSYQPHTSPLNVAAFQFTYADGNPIDNGNEITCTIKSLFFEYYCN